MVDRAVEGPLQGGQECIFWKSSDPDEIVRQIHEILDNYEVYEPIRERGRQVAKALFDPHPYVVRTLSAVARVTHGRVLEADP